MQTTFGQLQARTVCATALMLAVTFSAAAADSTFTDANWISMNPSIPGASGGIDAVVADSVGNLYIGGDFSVVGDVIAHGIAKWDGSSWSALGSGTDGEYPYVNTLAVSGSDLFMGGGFTVVGGKVSAYLARAYLQTLPGPSVFRSWNQVLVSWPSFDAAGFTLEQSGTLLPYLTWVPNVASVTDDGTNKSVILPATNSAQFFRLRGSSTLNPQK